MNIDELRQAYCATDDAVERRYLRKQWMAALRVADRKDARQLVRDEERETKANAFVCLIEALGEMRPYLPEDA